jgi:hypothetical protein
MPRSLPLACLFAASLPAFGGPPQVSRVTAPALQPGATTTLVVEGTDLIPAPRVLLPVLIASQAVKDGATATRVQIELKLAVNVPTGAYHLRIATDKGISNATGIEIDDMPQAAFGPQAGKLPVCLNGALPGNALTTSFEGKKGQRLAIEVEARRLGSMVEPVVKLLDARRVQLAWSQGSNTLGGDTRLTTELPAEGTYTVEMHDAQYRPGNPNRFRLRIGDFRSADLAFPLAGQRGTKATFQLIGSVPENTRVEADLTSAAGGAIVLLPRPAGVVGLMPHIQVSDIPEVMESAPSQGKLQEIALPAGINGRISKSGEEDSYRLKVQPGMKLRFDVLAERAGSLLDGVLVLRDERGTQLARSDDQPGTLDPGLEYTVPMGMTALVAAVSDVHGRGGPSYVYRLSAVPLNHPDFSLALSDDRLHVHRDGLTVLRVLAHCNGYTGPIKLTLPGLPDGISATGTDIPADAGGTLITLTVKPGAKPAQAVIPQLIGESTDPKVPLRRVALVPEVPQTYIPPWLRSELALASTEAAPISIAWESLDAKLPLGGKATAKVKLTRTAEAKTNIRLTLLTNQSVPKVKGTNTDDVNKAIRQEAAVQIAPNQPTPDVKLVIPADLPAMAYEVAIRADLLGPDQRTILASATTPVRRVPAAK